MDLSQATVGQLLIPVKNLEQAMSFYQRTLGLKFLFSAPPQMSFFQVGPVRLLVGVPETPQPQSATIYLKVDDIHSVHRELAARGVHFIGQPHLVHKTPASELWLAEFRDPDGNSFALMSEIATGETT